MVYAGRWWWGCLAAAAILAAPALAQTRWDLAIELDVGWLLESRLNRAGAEGFRCAVVGRPDAPRLPNTVVALLARPRDEASKTRVAYRVRTLPVSAGGLAGTLSRLDREINGDAAAGFRVCGMTLVRIRGGAADAYEIVVIMERLDGAGTPAREYRAIRTTGRRDEWRSLEQAAREGFAIRHVVWRPVPLQSAAADVTFLVERGEGAATPMELALKWHGNDVDLQKDVTSLAAEGYRLQAFWTGADMVSVLGARPVGGRFTEPVDYRVATPATFRVSPFDGGLIRMLPFDGGWIAFHDKRRTADYATFEGEVIDSTGFNRELGRVRDRLSAGIDPSFWPVDLVLRQARAADRLTLQAIFEGL